MCEKDEYIEPLEWPDEMPGWQQIEELHERLAEALMLPKEFFIRNDFA